MQKIKFLFLFLGFLASNDSVIAQQVNHFELNLASPVFTQGVPNLAVNIQFPSIPIWGWLEVTVTSGYSNQLAIGKLTKRYKIGHNVAGYFNQATEIPEAFGEVATQWNIGDFNHNTNSISIYHLVSTSNVLFIKIEGVLANAVDIDLLKAGTTISPLITATSPDTRQYMSIMQDRVGIGTLAPDEKLTVKGKIHTQEVRVDMAGPLVPDYVFTKDYNLRSLEELDEYIKENKHLPEIPSAQEIEKNGLMLAQMNIDLLKKIEELTLYMIDINKKVNELQINNTRLTEENKVLATKIKNIEKTK